MSSGHIRVSLSAGEIEVEGTEDFVAKYDETIDIILQRLREGKTPPGPAPSPQPQPGEEKVKSLDGFGEALHGFSNAATDTDKMLLAGSFAQSAGADNAFATKAASELLIEQGVKPSNPSQCMTNNLKAKRVIKVGKKYRVSKVGEAHLQKLGG